MHCFVSVRTLAIGNSAGDGGLAVVACMHGYFTTVLNDLLHLKQTLGGLAF